MSLVSQPDLHPDADILNAFVEHALTDSERARVVSHMGGCERCREIVFLAQAAAEPEAAVASAVIPESRPRWFALRSRKWSLSLIPAGAMAALAAVLVWVQWHPRSRPMEMAQLTSPTALVASQAPPGQTPAEASTAGQASGFSNSSARKALQIPPGTAVRAGENSTGILSQDRLRPNDSAVSPQRAMELENQMSKSGVIRFDARSAAPSPPQSPPAPTAGFSAARADRDQQRLPPPAAASASEIVTVSGASTSVASGISPAEPASIAELSRQSGDGMSVMLPAKRVQLPSGLNVVSSAAVLNQLVAIDSAGTVFLSQDGGKRWDSVKVQWSGKAIQVQSPQGHLALTRAATSAANNSIVETAAPAAAPTPAPKTAPASANPKPSPDFPVQFKLVTDRHQIWLSADGKVWRQQ